MFRRVAPLLGVLLALWPHDLAAGAWLRNEGQAFVAANVTQSATEDNDASIYGEYGLRPKTTIGGKIDTRMQGRVVAGGTAYVFIRRPITLDHDHWRVSYALGLGARFDDGAASPLYRTELSFGRGLEIGERSGWLNVDLSYQIEPSRDQTSTKIDATLGMELRSRLKGMVQVYVDRTNDNTTTTFAPALIWQPRGQQLSYVTGLEADNSQTRVKIGVWLEF